MSTLKTIKSKITSVSQVSDVTSALEMVSVVKLQHMKQKITHYKEFIRDFLPFVYTCSPQIAQLSSSPASRQLVIMYSSDRGLCGSFDTDMFATFDKRYASHKDTLDVFCLGKKWFESLIRAGYTVVWYAALPDDELQQEDLADLYNYIAIGLQKGEYSAISVYFNASHHTLRATSRSFDLYPFSKDNLDAFLWYMWVSRVAHTSLDVEVTPDMATEVLMQLLQHMLYGSLLQSKTAEYAARISAMKQAKHNAALLIKKLKVSFHKLRNALITSQVSAIISEKIAIQW
jgi:F-type H+-transporting ATPase subunit gamma